MNAGDIHTNKDLEGWLRERPLEVQLWVVYRECARKLPYFLNAFPFESVSGNSVKLTCFRCLHLLDELLLGSGPVGQLRLREASVVVDDVLATHSDFGIDVSQLEIIELVMKNAVSFAEQESVSSDVPEISTMFPSLGPFTDFLSDLRMFETVFQINQQPIWFEGPDTNALKLWASFCEAHNPSQSENDSQVEGKLPDYSSYWIPWYQGLLDGEEVFSPELRRAIALIEPEDWDKGDQHINNVVIPKLMDRRTALSQAHPVDFSFDALQKVMRMIGVGDDAAHLRDPKVIGAFVDDCDELKDTLQNFVDYTSEISGGGNRAGVLRRASENVLNEIQRAEDVEHLRARHVVRLAGQLEAFSKEEKARADLGETLSGMLDEAIGFLKTVTRQHFGPSYAALAPLADLEVEQIDQDAVVSLLDNMIVRLEDISGDELVPLDEEGLAIFRDMVREAHEFRIAVVSADADAFREVMESRFAESAGGVGLAFGRFLEKSNAAAGKAGNATDIAIKNYKRVKSLGDIVEMLQGWLNGGAPLP